MQFQYRTQRYSLTVERLLERGFGQGQHEGSTQHLEFQRLLGETLELAHPAVVISCGLSVPVFKIASNLFGFLIATVEIGLGGWRPTGAKPD